MWGHLLSVELDIFSLGMWIKKKEQQKQMEAQSVSSNMAPNISEEDKHQP